MNRQEWKGKKKDGRSPLPWWWVLLMIVSAVMILTGMIQLINRAVEDGKSRQTSAELRTVYDTATDTPVPLPETQDAAGTQDNAGAQGAVNGQEAAGTQDNTDAQDAAGTQEPAGAPGETEAPALTQEPTAEPEPAQTDSATPTPVPVQRLEEIPYPANPGGKISASFQALQRENRDIIGWLNIGSMVDEPVVQRDNVFYMTHDARKEENVNGAIFLDEFVSLKTRPYGMILYGHNMRTGGMFASLRNYEKVSFYRSYPFFTFNTAYEDGRYVIFSSGKVDVTDENSAHFLNVFDIMSRNAQERSRAIDVLKNISSFSCTVDVQPEDQLLLLVTCVGDEEERRVIAARRFREGETEEALKSQVSRSR